MAGIIIGEQRGRGSSISLFPNEQTETRMFNVRSDSRTDFSTDILSAPGVPRFGDAHPRNTRIYALDFQTTQDDEAWWLWVVEITYRIPEDGNDPTGDDPLAWDPIVTMDGEEALIAIDYAVDPTTGEPFEAAVNSAGEPFDPPPETELELLNIVVQRNEPEAFSVSTFFDYYNAVNDASWTFGDMTFLEGQVLLKPRISSVQIYVSNTTGQETRYREVTYNLRCNPLGWDVKLLDAGTFELIFADKVAFMTNMVGDIPAQPRIGLLDGEGSELQSGSDPVYITIKTKKRRNFDALNLPSGP